MKEDLLFSAVERLQEATDWYFDSKALSDCVVKYSAAAGISAMAGGVLPGAGAAIAIAIGSGAAWAMYIKMSNIIGVKIEKKTLKVIASAAISNVAANAVLLLAFSFIPGASILADGIITFASVYIAAIIFLTALTQIFKGKRTDVNDDEWKQSVKNAAKNINMKSAIKEARGIFTEMRNSGELENIGTGVDIDPSDDPDDE